MLYVLITKELKNHGLPLVVIILRWFRFTKQFNTELQFMFGTNINTLATISNVNTKGKVSVVGK